MCALLATLLASVRPALALDFEPAAQYPLRTVLIGGVSDSVDRIEFHAVPLIDGAADEGAAVDISARRAADGTLALVVPPHPDGFDAGGIFEMHIAGGVDSHPTDHAKTLQVLPLPRAGNESRRILNSLTTAFRSVARSSGTDPDQLMSAPPEEVPAHLLGVSIALKLLDDPSNPTSLRSLLDGNGPPEIQSHLDFEFGDRLLASAAFADDIESASGALAQLPPWPGPLEISRIPGAETFGKVEICRECPGALDHWMTVQTEYERGYDGLVEKLTRRRDLFDFLDSLTIHSDDPAERTIETGLGRADSWVRDRADYDLYDKLLTKRAKGGVNVAGIVVSVVEDVIDLGDTFRARLLPSEFSKIHASADPADFNEDAETPGAWSMAVTARSQTLSVDLEDLVDFLSEVQSTAGEVEETAFGELREREPTTREERFLARLRGDDPYKPTTLRGFCIAGGERVSEDPRDQPLGEAACQVTRESVAVMLKRYRQYQKAQSRAQAMTGGDPEVGPVLPDANPELVTLGPFEWPKIDVTQTNAEGALSDFTAARVIGDCVAIVQRVGTNNWSQISYAPGDPDGSSWKSGVRVAYQPAAVGPCALRITTHPDHFGEALPALTDVEVAVRQIAVQVLPDSLRLPGGETTDVDVHVLNADDREVDWSSTFGDGETLINCRPETDSKIQGRPCLRWRAPQLEEGECTVTHRITATSLSDGGLRGLPDAVPRLGFAEVEVFAPEAFMSIVHDGSDSDTLAAAPGTQHALAVTGADETTTVTWMQDGRTIGRGQRISYVVPEAVGEYRVTATSTGLEGECAPTLDVIVMPNGATVIYSGRFHGSYEAKPTRLAIQAVTKDRKACMVILSLQSKDSDDALMVSGWLPAPLAAGKYPVVHPSDMDGFAIGKLGENVWPDCKHQNCGSFRPGNPQHEGNLEILSISRKLVTGRLDLSGVSGGAVNTGLRAYFSIPLPGPDGLPASNPCAPGDDS